MGFATKEEKGPQAVGPVPPTMRAAHTHRYGPPNELTITQTAVPSPGPGAVLVRVRAAAVCRGDWHLHTGRPYVIRLMFGFRRPKHAITGQAFAGHVAAIGPGVTGFRIGDSVFGQGTHGAYAEYVVADQATIAPAPTGVSLEQAATVPLSGFTALQALALGDKVRSGARVLIHGASGGVGSLAVQIAHARGAHVVGVCGPDNLSFVRELGAAHAIDYSQNDPTAIDEQFDLVLDFVGNIAPRRFRRVMQPDGVFVSSAGPKGDWIAPFVQPIRVLSSSWFSSRSFRMFLAKPNPTDLATLRELVSSGTVRPIVGDCGPLAELPRLLEAVGAGHARGTRVVLP